MQLIPRCGNINIWHWAHKNVKGCDSWYGTETEWHLEWKSRFPVEWVEVPIVKNGQRHIADVLCPNGQVIEFQHSFLSPTMIGERERFYVTLAWVFDIQECLEPTRYYYGDPDAGEYWEERRFSMRYKSAEYYTFRWKYPRKHIGTTTTPTYLDIGSDLIFHLKRMYPNPPCGGWGYTMGKNEFIAQRI